MDNLAAQPTGLQNSVVASLPSHTISSPDATGEITLDPAAPRTPMRQMEGASHLECYGCVCPLSVLVNACCRYLPLPRFVAVLVVFVGATEIDP